MPFYIEQFIQDRKKPVVIKNTDSAINAIKLMQESDFSQIPVVNEDNNPIGMVTNESIIRRAVNFDVNLKELSINDVVQPAKKFQVDEDIFDLLNELKSSYAVLVVTSDGKLLDVFTSFDALEFFRQRFDDFMMVEDIEGMIQDLILNVYKGNEEKINSEKQKLLYEHMKRNDYQRIVMKPKLSKAVSSYLDSIGLNKKIKFDLIEEIIEEVISDERIIEFSDLSYDHYVRILLSDDVWKKYKKNIRLDKTAIRKLFDEARDSRNILAHFKGELSQQQRYQLDFCKNWLNRQMESIQINEKPEAEILIFISDEVTPTDEDIFPPEGKYSLFFDWLHTIPIEKDRITIKFNKFEDIIGSGLPESGRKHRAWWANDSVAHTHSILWLEAGWRTTYINLTEEKITFARIKEREKAYIDFYNSQLIHIKKYKNFPLKKYSPDGQNWHTVSNVFHEGSRIASYHFSFARRARYRIEMYIDSGQQEINKSLFDFIFAKKENIENMFEHDLSWERMVNKRASRIAFYQPGSITDNIDELKKLSHDSARLMNLFYKSTHQTLKEGIEKLYVSNLVRMGKAPLK